MKKDLGVAKSSSWDYHSSPPFLCLRWGEVIVLHHAKSLLLHGQMDGREVGDIPWNEGWK